MEYLYVFTKGSPEDGEGNHDPKILGLSPILSELEKIQNEYLSDLSDDILTTNGTFLDLDSCDTSRDLYFTTYRVPVTEVSLSSHNLIDAPKPIFDNYLGDYPVQSVLQFTVYYHVTIHAEEYITIEGRRVDAYPGDLELQIYDCDWNDVTDQWTDPSSNLPE